MRPHFFQYLSSYLLISILQFVRARVARWLGDLLIPLNF